MSLELEAPATVLVLVHCSRDDDARCRQALPRNILPLVPTLGAGQASAKEWAKRRSYEALAQRPPVTARKAATTLDWQTVRSRPVSKRESDSSNMCVKALSRGECALRTTSVTTMQVIFVSGMQAGPVA